MNPLRYSNDPELYAYASIASSCGTRHITDLKKQAILLRSAENSGMYEEVRRMILDARAEWLTYLTTQQRKWQTMVSRRPQRTRHHDSWAQRESTVRGGNYTDYLPTKGSPPRCRH